MSKFKGIFDAKSNEQNKVNTKTLQAEKTETTLTLETKVGRPKGKRSNPDYEQVTAYVKKDTYRAVKIALLQASNKQEFSDLLEELLSKWLKSIV